MDQQGTIKETNLEVHGSLPTLQEDINVENQVHGKINMRWNKVKVTRKKLDIMFNFHWDGWSVVLGTS
jgi:hypothetical protein